ncbi:head-tail connector protein [Stappia stellulata]|uniref:portal protein n=1 Tax=Stappia stellulata TaxID=71235 RepID=UPI001CD547D2|nr:portal protein [Stappia stellulata]MCA1241865.1 head-tail connector protein [Stappia stellulata]
MEFQRVKKRSQKAWENRTPWDALYQEAYDFAIPQRRPGGSGNSKRSGDFLFDMTAPTSTMHFAGNLQRDLFPSGQPPFTYETGPVAAMAIGPRGVSTYNRVVERQAKLMHPFFHAGDWDTAIHETCIDLSVGTGAIIPIKGTSDEPVRFGSIPFDQIALECDAYGRVVLISWKQIFTRDQILSAYPEGRYPENWREEARSTKGSEEVTFYQVFVMAGPSRRAGWEFTGYLENSTEPVVTKRYRTQPIAVPRYYRVPGEAYGRGVVLTALPSIKTVNKAQEIALKSAAIQMMGIWGYRAGGTFNPDTARLGPGEFWPMSATGGVLGPDVQRIDPAGGRMDIAKMLIGNLQEQIREALLDQRLPEYQGTPRAASEIAARLRQRADVHIGAFGRLVREIMPVIAPRVSEILYDFGLFSQMPMTIDELLVSIKVQSPMAAALNADRLALIANYLEFAGAVAGPDSVELYANIDKIMERVGDGLQIDKDLIPNETEKAAIQQKIRERQQAQMAQMFAQEAAKQAPKMIADAAGAEERMAA